MELIKKQYPVHDEKERKRILKRIKGKRVEVFYMPDNQLLVGEVTACDDPIFRFHSDTGESHLFHLNDVEIKV